MRIQRMEDLADSTRRITFTNKYQIDLVLEEDTVGIFAERTEVGRLTFQCENEYGRTPSYKLSARITNASIDADAGRYHWHDVGTEAVIFFLECTGYALELPGGENGLHDDGLDVSGGSAEFIASLRKRRAQGEL